MRTLAALARDKKSCVSPPGRFYGKGLTCWFVDLVFSARGYVVPTYAP